MKQATRFVPSHGRMQCAELVRGVLLGASVLCGVGCVQEVGDAEDDDALGALNAVSFGNGCTPSSSPGSQRERFIVDLSSAAPVGQYGLSSQLTISYTLSGQAKTLSFPVTFWKWAPAQRIIIEGPAGIDLSNVNVFGDGKANLVNRGAYCGTEPPTIPQNATKYLCDVNIGMIGQACEFSKKGCYVPGTSDPAQFTDATWFNPTPCSHVGVQYGEVVDTCSDCPLTYPQAYSEVSERATQPYANLCASASTASPTAYENGPCTSWVPSTCSVTAKIVNATTCKVMEAIPVTPVNAV